MAKHSLPDGSAPSKTLTLALLTPGVSQELAASITQYVADLDAYRASDPGPYDHLDYTNFGQARDFHARSAEDVAAKLALSMSELRGCSITPAEVVIDEEFCFDLPSEEMVLAALVDARRLAGEKQRIGTELAALIEAGRQASAAAADFYDNVCAPADDAAAAEIAAIPHFTTTSSWDVGEGARRHLTTSSETDVRMARLWIRLIDQGQPWSLSPEKVATCRELVAALDDRSARIEEVNKKWRLAEQNARCDELGSAASVAEMAALRCPATSLAELLAKLEYAREIEVDLDQIADEIHADVRRLAGAKA